jgi:hypothetical protein
MGMTMPISGIRSPLRRAMLAVLLAAFTATGQGLSALEVVAHLASPEQVEHARTPHYESPDSGSHSDHCHLGLHLTDTRLFTGPPTRVSAPVITTQPAPALAVRVIAFRPTPAGLPRAPPRSTLSIG